MNSETEDLVTVKTLERPTVNLDIYGHISSGGYILTLFLMLDRNLID